MITKLLNKIITSHKVKRNCCGWFILINSVLLLFFYQEDSIAKKRLNKRTKNVCHKHTYGYKQLTHKHPCPEIFIPMIHIVYITAGNFHIFLSIVIFLKITGFYKGGATHSPLSSMRPWSGHAGP